MPYEKISFIKFRTVICDCKNGTYRYFDGWGLWTPNPQETQRIDLALRKGTPGFLETLDTILEELCVQEIILAEEMKDVSPELWHETLRRFPNIKVTYVSHEKLKELTKKSRAVVRTGETTSYANVILVSGVTF